MYAKEVSVEVLCAKCLHVGRVSVCSSMLLHTASVVLLLQQELLLLNAIVVRLPGHCTPAAALLLPIVALYT